MDYECRSWYALFVSDKCASDRIYCSVNEWYEDEQEDPLTSLGDPAYTLAVLEFEMCLDDEFDVCDTDIIRKAIMVLESRGYFDEASSMVFLDEHRNSSKSCEA